MRKQPKLRTNRLVLRRIKISDFPWYADFWKEPEVVEFIGGEPRSEEDLWTRFLANFGSWSELGFGLWLIERKFDAAAVGLAGIFQAKRSLPGFCDVPEAGWALTPEMFGHSYAYEAMQAVLAWADDNLVSEIRCVIDLPNIKSIKIAERLGFCRVGEGYLDGANVTIWNRHRQCSPRYANFR